jgi:hypothetical protein
MTKRQSPINDERRIMTNRAVRHWAFAGHWGLIGHWVWRLAIPYLEMEVDDEHL